MKAIGGGEERIKIQGELSLLLRCHGRDKCCPLARERNMLMNRGGEDHAHTTAPNLSLLFRATATPTYFLSIHSRSLKSATTTEPKSAFVRIKRQAQYSR